MLANNLFLKIGKSLKEKNIGKKFIMK